MTALKAFVAAVLIGTISASYAAADEPAAFQAQYPDRDVLNGGALTPEGRLKRACPVPRATPVSHSGHSAIPGTCPQPASGTVGAVTDLAECEPKGETCAAAFSADLLQAFFETRPVRGIELRGASHFLDLGRFERADHPRR